MQNKRNTIQKELILATLLKMHNHPSADMVYKCICETYSTISRATVFRVLNQLSEDNIISKISMINSADCYDYKIHKHYHIRCAQCGHVDDIEMPYMDSISNSIKSSSGYKVTSHTVIFEGICPECQRHNGESV